MPKVQQSKVGTNADVKKYAERVISSLDEKDGLSEDIKELKVEAKENGIDMKALDEAIKYHRKPPEKDHVATVNKYLGIIGAELRFVE